MKRDGNNILTFDKLYEKANNIKLIHKTKFNRICEKANDKDSRLAIRMNNDDDLSSLELFDLFDFLIREKIVDKIENDKYIDYVINDIERLILNMVCYNNMLEHCLVSNGIEYVIGKMPSIEVENEKTKGR